MTCRGGLVLIKYYYMILEELFKNLTNQSSEHWLRHRKTSMLAGTNGLRRQVSIRTLCKVARCTKCLNLVMVVVIVRLV